MHVGYEAWEEHLAVVLGVEVRRLLWSQPQPPLLKEEAKVMTGGELNVNMVNRSIYGHLLQRLAATSQILISYLLFGSSQIS